MKIHLFVAIVMLIAALVTAALSDPIPAATPGAHAAVTSKATITVDVNGEKQTREIDLGKFNLGDALQIKVGDGSGAPGVTVSTSGGPGVNVAPVRRTWLGVSADELSDELRAQLPISAGAGLLVRSVVADGPAERAGVLKNDVLEKFDDQLLVNSKQLRTLVGTKKEGDVVRLTYLRKGQEATAEVKLAMHEGVEAAEDPWGLSQLLGKGWLGKVVGPIFSGAMVTDKDGNVISSQGTPDVSDAAKQLEKTLRDAGVDEKTIELTKKALTDAAAGIQKAAGDLTAAKGDIAREVQKAADQAKQAVEQARREAEEAARKAAPPGPKAP